MGLYTLGPFYPATAESVSESPFSGTSNFWTRPAQVSAKDGYWASITGTLFDTNTKTWVLKAYNFTGFTGVPANATILGVQATISAMQVGGTTAPQLALGQLLSNQRAKGGTNQYATPQAITTSPANYSKGSTGDLWGNALSAAWVQHSGFGVAYALSAKSNNTTVSANYVTMQLWYSIPDSYITDPGADALTIVGTGGVSTTYFATDVTTGAPQAEFPVAADYSYEAAALYQTITLDGSVSVSVDSGVSDAHLDAVLTVGCNEEASAGASAYLSADVPVGVATSVGVGSTYALSAYPDAAAQVTIDSAAAMAKTLNWYLPTSLALTKGAIVSGSLSDIYSDNDVYLVLSEELLVPGFTYEFTFGGDAYVPSPVLFLHVKAYYDGILGHLIKLAQWNYDTSGYVDVTADATDFYSNASELYYNFTLINNASYLSGGQIKLRIQHESYGNVLHEFEIDTLHLSTLADYQHYGAAAEAVQVAPELKTGVVIDGSVAVTFDCGAVITTTTAQSFAVMGDASAELSCAADTSLSVLSTLVGEFGTAVWSVYGGVSTLYASTQRDAGVPIGAFAVGDDCYLYRPTIKTVVLEGSVAEVLEVGDYGVVASVIILPKIDGAVFSELSYSADLSIYATPQYQTYQVEGNVSWRMAEPVSEYWVGIAGDRPFPLHDFAAAAEYSTNSQQHWLHDADVYGSFNADSLSFRGFGPAANVYEVMAAGADYFGYTARNIVLEGVATQFVGIPSERPVAAHVADAGVAENLYASHDVVTENTTVLATVEGSVSEYLSTGSVCQFNTLEAFEYVGDVVFNAESVAEKAVANLYDALAEYTSTASTVHSYHKWTYAEDYEHEPRPVWSHTGEAKPSQTNTKEPVPVAPPGQDGMWALDGQDGFVTEPPKHGAYDDVGYYKEWKPWLNTYSKESRPEKEIGIDGFVTVDGTDGLLTEPPVHGAYSAGRPRYLKEGKPT